MANTDCRSRYGTIISVMILGVLIFSTVLAYLVSEDNNDDEHGLRNVRMIAILFRHGEKTPSEFYPNDKHASHHDWPLGLGALTQNGKLQAFNLGKNLRRRYFRLLPPNGIYTQKQMLVTSSAAERCLMSAQAVLAGFMPPLEHNNALPINWQPVPVSVVARNEDILLAQKKPCAKYNDVLQNFYNNPPSDIKELNDQNAALYKLLSTHTGKNISSVLDVELLYNTLKTEIEAGLPLPDWAENIYPDQLQTLAERSYALFSETDFMKKVKGGAFLTEVLRKMEDKLRKNLNPDRSMFLYSGHDVTLVNVMNSLNILDQTSKLPEYASALSFELHHNSFLDDGFEVKLVYFFNSEDKFPKDINIPNCAAPCSLAQFRESLKSLIMENYDETCENPIPQCNTSTV